MRRSYVNAETVGRFLDSMRQAKTPERYVGNVGFYLAAWAEALAGRGRAPSLPGTLPSR
jgi:hypothetical protein